MLFVIALIGLLSTLAIPGLMRARGAAQSASALGTMRVVNSAQLSFAITCGLGFYSPDFQTLGVTPPRRSRRSWRRRCRQVRRSSRAATTSAWPAPAVVAHPASCNGLGAGRHRPAMRWSPIRSTSTPQAATSAPTPTASSTRTPRATRRPCPRRRAAGGAPDQVSSSRLDADARATNAARHVGAAPRLLPPSSHPESTLPFALSGIVTPSFWEGERCSRVQARQRVLAASLVLLAVQPATADRGDGADGHDAEAALRLQHRRRLPARHLHAVRRLLAEARQGIRADEGGGDRQDGRRPAAADGDHHLSREPQEARPLQGDLAPARAGRGPDRRAGARAREGRQGRRLVRRRPARDRGARRAPADRDRLSARQPERRRDDALPERPGDPRRARQSGRHGARVELVHARERADAALVERPAAALPEVHRPRQQPRLLHVDAAREHEHEPGDVHRVVPADHVQPSPDRPGRHGDVRAAVPRSVQLQLRSAHPVAARPRRRGDAQPLCRRRASPA